MFRVARLLTALLVFTLLAANSASATTAVSAEKPTSGLFGVLEQRVGIDALASSDRVDEKLSLLYDFASDFPVAARGLAGFTAREAAVLAEARGILASSELGALRAAHAAGRSASVSIGGRTILYEPGLSASGMTLFGENGFVIGRGAFSSGGEFGRTVLHELYRLSHSGAAGGVSGALATQETAAAAGFAERAAAALGL